MNSVHETRTHTVEYILCLPNATPTFFNPLPNKGSLWVRSGSPSHTKKLITTCSEVNPPKSIARVNLPENEPCLSINSSVSDSSISPVSESTTFSSISCAIWHKAFDAINWLTGSSFFKNSTVSLYGASPSCVLIWTFMSGIFNIWPLKYLIYSSIFEANFGGFERRIFMQSMISFALAVGVAIKLI